MNYGELKQIFQELKHRSPMEDLTAHVTFTEDSFDKPYSLLSRTYSFMENCGTCCKCGSPLFKSPLPGYTFQCFTCDEDFYQLEQNT